VLGTASGVAVKSVVCESVDGVVGLGLVGELLVDVGGIFVATGVSVGATVAIGVSVGTDVLVGTGVFVGTLVGVDVNAKLAIALPVDGFANTPNPISIKIKINKKNLVFVSITPSHILF
jgi:hypothetical protein